MQHRTAWHRAHMLLASSDKPPPRARPELQSAVQQLLPVV
jgi:hypothetical protein